MATGDAAAAAGLAVFASTQDIRLGYNNDNVRGDELATHMTSGTHPASAITSGTLDAARIPTLDASKIGTGTLADARIPNLAASKITSGTITRPVSASGSISASGTITAGGYVTGASLWTNGALQAYGVLSTPLGSWTSVVTNASGYLGYGSSTKRVKQDISDASLSETAGLELRPVTFRYKQDVKDMGDAAPFTVGLIAEELDELGYRDFVIYDAKGKPNGIHYERAWLALVPVVQQLARRVAELEAKEGN